MYILFLHYSVEMQEYKYSGPGWLNELARWI